MSGFTLRLRHAPETQVNLSAVTAAPLGSASAYDLENLDIGIVPGLKLGDIFSVSGTAGETLTIDGATSRLDYIGAGLDGGTLVVNGDTGAYAGRLMKAGKLVINGNAGPALASGLTGGTVHVKGSAGDALGALLPGDRYGIAGGIVIVDGDAGARAAEKMRRGTVIVRGMVGPQAAARSLGGTVITEKGFGPGFGSLMRRGMLIAPRVDQIPATFSDCGRHDLLILKIMARYFRQSLGDAAPRLPEGSVRRYAGDMATIGKGELLLPA
jgi:formylmethanofuran dehydrogenase subunit C